MASLLRPSTFSRAWRLLTLSAALFSAWHASAQAPSPPVDAAPADEVSRIPLDAPLLYELLLGEMTAAQGDAQDAVALLLDAAGKTNLQTLYQRATEVALRARSGPLALRSARAWQQAFPQSRLANRYLLQILLMLNRVSDTVEPLSQELAATPPGSKAAAYLAIAQLYRHASDKKLAAAVVEQALQADLNDTASAPAAWAMLGHMRLAAGQKEAALEAARHAQQLAPDNGAAALLALELLENHVPQAEPLVQAYLERTPALAIRLAYAKVLLDQQRLAPAQVQLNAAVAQAPDNLEAWFTLAATHAQQGQWNDAEQSLQRFTDLIPTLATPEQRSAAWKQAGLLGARSALAAKNHGLAQQWLERIPPTENDFTVQALRATVLARQGKLKQARQLLRALPAEGKQQTQRKQQAEVQLLRDAGAYAQAYALQAQLQAQDPENPDITYETALLAEKIGQLDTMEQLLRSIMARHPDYHHAYNALGYSLADRGEQLPEARRLIEKALEYAPNDPFITDSLGWLTYREGNLPEALALLEHAYRLRDDVEIATHLAEVLWVSGNPERARSLWRAALQRDPDNAVLRETLQRLNVQP